MAEKLSDSGRRGALAKLKGWKKVRGRNAIEKQFQFKNFNEAFGWMSRIAMLAEKIDHHPEWSNVYRTVNVVLTTHDADGVSELDIKMATAMNRFSAENLT